MLDKKDTCILFGLFFFCIGVLIVILYVQAIFDLWLGPPSRSELEEWASRDKTATAAAYWHGCETMQVNHPEWVYFNTGNSELLSDVVLDLLIDDGGDIWIATNLGVSRFDYETWTNYSQESDSFQLVREIVAAPDGRIWAAASNGVFIWTNNRWESVWQQPGTIAFDNNSRAWIGVRNGAIILDADSLGLVHQLSFGELKLGDVAEVGIDPIGQVHIRYSDENIYIDANNFSKLDSNAYLVGEEYWFFTSDSAGNAWFESDEELVRSDGETITSYTPENSSLPGHQVHELKIDPFGHTWLSTTTRKIVYLDHGKWITVVDDPYGRGNHSAFPFDFDEDGNLWFGFHSGVRYGCGVIMIPRTELKIP